MYNATLYVPGQEARTLTPAEVSGLQIESAVTLFSCIDAAGQMMGITPQSVDILDCNPHYLIYSGFDHAYDRNLPAEAEANQLIPGSFFGHTEELTHLYGPVLIITFPKA